MRSGLDAPLETGLRLERRGYQLMFGTSDFREGVKAFADKRDPQFNRRMIRCRAERSGWHGREPDRPTVAIASPRGRSGLGAYG